MNRTPRHSGITGRTLLAASLSLSLLAVATMLPAQSSHRAKTNRPTARSSRSTRAQVRSQPTRVPTAPARSVNKKPAIKKARGRLPRYYGKVGLSKPQRERIYAIQATYRLKTEALTKQLMELRDRQDRDVRNCLTPLQQDRLDELVEMARKARVRPKTGRKASKRSSD